MLENLVFVVSRIKQMHLCVCGLVQPSASRKLGSNRPAKDFVGWNRRVPHDIKIATFRDDGEVEEVFTSTTVRTRDAVFPVFGGAGAKPATEAELREFGENVSARPDEAEGPSLVLALGGKVVENNPILKSCEDEPRRPVLAQPEPIPR